MLWKMQEDGFATLHFELGSMGRDSHRLPHCLAESVCIVTMRLWAAVIVVAMTPVVAVQSSYSATAFCVLSPAPGVSAASSCLLRALQTTTATCRCPRRIVRRRPSVNNQCASTGTAAANMFSLGNQDAINVDNAIQHNDGEAVTVGTAGGPNPLSAAYACNAFASNLGRLLTAVSPTFLVATTVVAQPSTAAVTGGRIGGGSQSYPTTPPMQQQQQQQQPRQEPGRVYSPTRAGRDIESSGGGRVHVTYWGQRPGARRGRQRPFNPAVGDVVSTKVTAGDVVVVGGVTAGVMAIQRYNRDRHEEGGEYHRGGAPAATRGWNAPPSKKGKETAVVTTLQVAMFCDRGNGRGDALNTLTEMSQSADVNTAGGLSALVNEVCLTLLRSEADWVGTTGGIKEYTPQGGDGGGSGGNREKTSPRARAKRDFNRAAMRERSKWERETVSTTPERGFSSSTAPGWRSQQATSASAGTYAVVTLMVAWSGLRSTPPQRETRRVGWFWQNVNRDEGGTSGGFSVENRQSALTFLEWLGDEAAEGRGLNILDVEVLWTPADPDDSLERDDLYTKWPELRGV